MIQFNNSPYYIWCWHIACCQCFFVPQPVKTLYHSRQTFYIQRYYLHGTIIIAQKAATYITVIFLDDRYVTDSILKAALNEKAFNFFCLINIFIDDKTYKLSFYSYVKEVTKNILSKCESNALLLRSQSWDELCF